MKNITREEAIACAVAIEDELIRAQKISFDRDKKWSHKFPDAPGVYAIFDNDILVYFGETANLRDRMKEVKRTYNHSFRVKLGRKLFNNEAVIKGHFSRETEKTLDEYYLNNISFTFRELHFGRLEVEEYLIEKNHGKLLNSKARRGT